MTCRCGETLIEIATGRLTPFRYLQPVRFVADTLLIAARQSCRIVSLVAVAAAFGESPCYCLGVPGAGSATSCRFFHVIEKARRWQIPSMSAL
jgi:hypothetical protein